MLLNLLRENARTSTAELARKLHLSRTTVQSRIERLERNHVVTGYTIKVPDEIEASLVRTFVLITLAPKRSAPSKPPCAASPKCARSTRSVVPSTLWPSWPQPPSANWMRSLIASACWTASNNHFGHRPFDTHRTLAEADQGQGHERNRGPHELGQDEHGKQSAFPGSIAPEKAAMAYVPRSKPASLYEQGLAGG